MAIAKLPATNTGPLSNNTMRDRINSIIDDLKVAATVSSSPPSNPIEGYLWVEESSARLYVYIGSPSDSWVEIIGSGGGGGGGGASVSTGTEAPTDPAEGDLWFNENVGSLFVYIDSTGWIETNPGGGGGSGNCDILPNYLYLDVQSLQGQSLPNRPLATMQLAGGSSGTFDIEFGYYDTSYVIEASQSRIDNDLQLIQKTNQQDINKLTCKYDLTSDTLTIEGVDQVFTASAINDVFEAFLEIDVRYVKAEYYAISIDSNGLLTFYLAQQRRWDTYIWTQSYDSSTVSYWMGHPAGQKQYAKITEYVGGGGGGGPRAYVAFDGTAADLTASITNSYNVSTITDVSTGTYRINFSTSVPNPVVSYSYKTTMTNSSEINNDHRCITSVSDTDVTVAERSATKFDTAYTSIVVH